MNNFLRAQSARPAAGDPLVAAERAADSIHHPRRAGEGYARRGLESSADRGGLCHVWRDGDGSREIATMIQPPGEQPGGFLI